MTMKTVLMGGRQNANPEDIILLQANENYTDVVFKNGRKLTVATTLKILEKRFSDCSEFFRTHKSFLINLNYIDQLCSTPQKTFVQMNNGYRVEIARRRKSAFFRKTEMQTTIV